MYICSSYVIYVPKPKACPPFHISRLVKRAINIFLILMIKLASTATRPIGSATLKNFNTTDAQWFVTVSAAVAAIFTQFQITI